MVTLAAAFCLLLSVPATAQSGAAGSLLAANSPRAAEARLDSPNPPAEGEIRALEAQVQIVLTEARRQQELLAEQRQRLAVAEAANAWLPWLLLAVVGLGALTAWLALRVWRLQQDPARPQQHVDSAHAAAASSVSLSGTDLVSPRVSQSVSQFGAERPLLSGAASLAGSGAHADSRSFGPRPMAGQGAMSGGAGLSLHEFSLVTGVPQRPVSVEELLDLDQQVDFFLALGQEQSAIDLLLSHVRGSGGTSALPYFKLLEIYRQQGDEEAYERTRERFNQRFNAFAPGWSGDLAGGRLLEDYPDVLLRLQRAWPQPMRAVAELESLLLRRADLEPFDLPAYREVLLLHALVRDLPAAPIVAPAAVTAPAVLARDARLDTQRVDMRADQRHDLRHDQQLLSPQPEPAAPPVPVAVVDLLLPLGEEPLDITAPRPHLSERTSAQAMLADWVFTRAAMARAPAAADAGLDRPLIASRPMKLDLDLSDYAPAPREFTRPAAFTDIDLRRDKRLSGLSGLDGVESDPSPLPSRR